MHLPNVCEFKGAKRGDIMHSLDVERLFHFGIGRDVDVQEDEPQKEPFKRLAIHSLVSNSGK